MSENDISRMSQCIRCGAAFFCGIAAGENTCWCMDKPATFSVPEDEATGCYCPDCLDQKIEEQQG